MFGVFFLINIKTRFIGIRKIGAAMRAAFSAKGETGADSPIKSACISLCATVGTGNIVGVAGAVSLGGAGAVFWMWLSGGLAMSVKFYEVYLSRILRGKGGAFGYIYAAFGGRWARTALCVAGLFAALGIGNLTQANAAADSTVILLSGTYIPSQTVKIVLGVLFAAAAFILLKKERIAADFCRVFLPFMAAGYIALCFLALIISRANLPQIFYSIIKGAFCPKAVTGGAVGSVFYAVKSGVARGVFSNEAGLSTAALAYEKSNGSPYNISLLAIFEVFVDTILLCTLTALVILSADNIPYGEDPGAKVVMSAFIGTLGRWCVVVFCPIVCFFAFSSVIGWGIYARRFAAKLSINENLTVLVYTACCILGACGGAAAVWQAAEITSVLMMTVNCSALLSHIKNILPTKDYNL